MKALVVYYSLSGTTRTLATALAKELGADVEEIRCTRYAPRLSGVVRAIYDTWRGNLPPIAPLSRDLSAYDLIVVGGPIWASHPATPVRAFLRQTGGRPHAVAFFLTYGGSGGEPALGEMQNLADTTPKATLLVRAANVKSGGYASALSNFASKLARSKAA